MFATKAQEIKIQGEMARGEFNPRPGTAHLKMYKYWLDNGGLAPKQENFCHYWRVVIFWGPVFWLVLTVLIPLFTSRPMRAFGRGLGKIFSTPADAYIQIPHEKRRKFWDTVALIFGIVVGLFFLGLVAVAFFKEPIESLIVTAAAIGFLAAAIGFGYLVSVLIDRADKRRMAQRDSFFEKLDKGEITWEQFDSIGNKKPWRIRKFFRGVGEFLVLLFQVVRVKKWKVCPLVTIPEKSA